MTDELYWYWFNNICGVGRKTMYRLLELFGNPNVIFEMADEEILPYLNDEKTRVAYIQSKNTGKIEYEYEELLKRKIRFLYPGHLEYPKKYHEIMDAPLGLYLKGRMPNDNQKAIAIIGARNCTRYGMEMARFFGRELANCKVAVISGLARGVDGMAHAGALEVQGYTIGIVGGGIDQIYPKENYDLFMKMEKSGGILSESNVGVVPSAGLFPQRNRLIAGLCDGILVVEAMERSGTFITVDQGLEQGKEIFAIPGRITDSKSVGCNDLIKLGAHAVTSVEDVLEILNVNEKNTRIHSRKMLLSCGSSKMLLAPREKIVYSCLRIEPRYLDDIIGEAKIAPQEVCKILNQLSLAGVIIESPRNYYAIRL